MFARYDECRKARRNIDYDSVVLPSMQQFIDVAHILYALSSNEASYMVSFLDHYSSCQFLLAQCISFIICSISLARRAPLVPVTACY